MEVDTDREKTQAVRWRWLAFGALNRCTGSELDSMREQAMYYK